MNKSYRNVLLGLLLTCFATQSYGYTIYVSNEKDNTISVIDGDSLEVVETIDVGQRPRGIVLSNDGTLLYMCTSDDNHVEVMNVETKEILHTLPSGPDPELMALSPDGKYLYIANEDDNLVTVVDVDERLKVTEIPVGIEPEGIGLSPDGKWLVNTSETTNMAHFINTETLEIEANVLVDTRPRVAQFTQDGGEVWVSAEIGGSVAVIDTDTKEIKTRITFDVRGLPPETIQPVGIKLSTDGSNKAYIALGPSARVAVVDMTTYEVEDYMLVGPRVWNLEFSPDQKRLFTTNGVSGDVSVIDLEKQRVIKSVKVGRLPWGIVVRP
ncbi:MAG: PQQ-dependent catabolism-associated beta-propeller protein [Granulosicoccus sp.]